MSLTSEVDRYVRLKRNLGYKFVDNERMLLSYARFATDNHDELIRSDTAVDWASRAPSPERSCVKLRVVRAFAISLHAENNRHEIPPRNVFGRSRARRTSPHLMTTGQIERLMEVALSVQPVDSITPQTWHYLFGLVAVTGLRVSEATALLVSDITPDGLVIRQTKFHKDRLVYILPSVRHALDDYLVFRRRTGGCDNHLFVLSTGRPTTPGYACAVFHKIARKAGLRGDRGTPGPTPHDLRHSFAVRSLENMGDREDPDRHMLALATYLGHTHVSGTYWYLEATPALLRGIAETAERVHARRSEP